MNSTNNDNGRNPGELLPTRDAVRRLIACGFAPIPLPPHSKAAVISGWPQLRITADAVDQHFTHDANVGILNGAPSGGLVDVDLDCSEARRAAENLLPPTDMITGRASASDSHWWYRVEAAPPTTESFVDPTASCTDAHGNTTTAVRSSHKLLELRTTGSQTVVPPSIYPAEPQKGHTTAERCVWSRFGEPVQISIARLRAAVAEVAAAALLARHWPVGARHDASLALAGALLRDGWSPDRVETFVRAVCAAAEDEEAKDRVRSVRDTVERLSAGDPSTGWPRLTDVLGTNGPAIVDRVRAWLPPLPLIPAAAAAPTAAAPMPEPEWPAPPGDEAYHGLAGDLVRTIEPASEADPAAILIQLLVAFGNVIGRNAHFAVEADTHFANEFAVLVGQSGKGRKGTSRGQVLNLFRAHDQEWDRDRCLGGLSSGEGLIWAVRDPVEKLERVKERGQPPRYEMVESDPGVADKRLMVFESEFANVLKQTERQGNTLSPLIRLAWETGDLRTMTKNSPARATGAHISIIGHITDEELRRYLTMTESANGFANRFLWVAVRRSKYLPDGGRPDQHRLAMLGSRLGSAIAHARTAGLVTRDAQASALWRGVYRQLSDGRPGLAGAMLGRAEAHVMRLAMLYALLDQSQMIRIDHLTAALTLWDYCERSVLHLFGTTLGDRVADDILRLLCASNSGLTRTEMSYLLGKNIPSERIERALALLHRHGLATVARIPTEGRPADRWIATKQ